MMKNIIVTDQALLGRMANAGCIKRPSEVLVPHESSEFYFIEVAHDAEGLELTSFIFEGQEYVVRKHDLCFLPFVCREEVEEVA